MIRYWTKIGALVLALCVGVPGLSPGPAMAADNSISISLNSWVGWGPLFIAQKKGWFGDSAVTLTFVEDAGARRLSMISGQVDSYASSVDNLAIDATFGVKGKTVLCFDESAGADGIIAKSNINWDNIRGRTVAVQQGLPGHFLLLSALKEHGLKPNDVKILDLDADKAGSGFVSGTIDIAVTWEPWISKAAAMAGGKKLLTTAELPGSIVDTWVIRDSLIDTKANVIRQVIKGWFKALEWYEQNKSEGNDIIAAAYHLKPEEVNDLVAGIKFYDLKRNQEYMGTDQAPGRIYSVFANASQLWKDAGITKVTVDPKQYIDPQFVQSLP
jgi:NitT/TauT family transport system substrate-binding protein